MSHYIKVFNNNICIFLFHSFFIMLKSHSYGSLVSLSQVRFRPMCVESYRSNYILYVSHEAQILGK